MTTQAVVKIHQQPSFLSRVLQANGAFSGLSGLAFVLAAQPIATFLGISAPVILTAVGIGLLIYAVDLFFLASRTPLNRQWVKAAIAMDLVWVMGSIVLLVTPWVPFTVEGKWAIAIVADLVAVFAVLQFYGLRKTPQA